MSRRKTASRPVGQVRIIGGQWRSRVLRFPADGAARPSGDRVRETLFNWLTPWLPGAHCVDLFAGTGALGFEAVSRGAASALLIEQDAAMAEALRRNVQALGAGESVQVMQGDARLALGAGTTPIDIAFVDPPFRAGLLAATLEGLVPRLAGRHRVYVEHGADETPDWPPGWSPVKSGKAGRVRYHLLVHANTAQGAP